MIDILLATYNGAIYLEEQLHSIESQTYKNWRLRVHDDGSSDGTWEMLEEFQKKHGEKKVIIKKNIPPTGASKRNFISLIQASDAEYMMCCDQDDVWYRDKVEKTYKRMRQMEQRYGKETPLLVHTDLKVVDAHLNKIHESFHKSMNLRTSNYLHYELVQNQVTGCTVMVNAILKKYVDLVKNTDKIVMHDHWLALIALSFGKMSYLDEATMAYRQHENNVVGAQNANSFNYMWRRFKRGKTKFIEDMKASCEQACYFCMLYETCMCEQKMIQLLDTYKNLYQKNKAARIVTFFKYRLWKKGIVRRIMQVIWG